MRLGLVNVGANGAEVLLVLAQADGSLKHFYMTFHYEASRRLDGTIYGVTATCIDVTELVLGRLQIERASEALKNARDDLRIALESAKMGVWKINLATNIIVGSAYTAKIFGVESMHENIFDAHLGEKVWIQSLL